MSEPIEIHRARNLIVTRMRAENFLHGRDLAEIRELCKLLIEHIQPELMTYMKTRIALSFTQDSRDWWESLVHWLSHVSDDKVWDESVARVAYVFHQVRIERHGMRTLLPFKLTRTLFALYEVVNSCPEAEKAFEKHCGDRAAQDAAEDAEQLIGGVGIA